MNDQPRFSEDLFQLAAEAPAIARQFCDTCENLHLLWPFIRLAGSSGGPGVGEDIISAGLSRLLSSHGRKVLIAGAADSGLLAVVARAVRPEVRIVVMDRCETPLELSRRFASRWSLSIDTMRVDLVEFEPQPVFDAVLAHSVLWYVPAERRVDVLSRLRRALRPGGRLIIMFSTSGQIDGGYLTDYRRSYPVNLIERLDRLNVPLPTPRDEFLRRIELYAEYRRTYEGAHPSRAAVEELMESAGFAVEEVTLIDSGLSSPFRQLTAKIDKQYFVAIAAPRS